MNAIYKNLEVEIIEQLSSGLWSVIIIETCEFIEVNEHELTNIEY